MTVSFSVFNCFFVVVVAAAAAAAVVVFSAPPHSPKNLQDFSFIHLIGPFLTNVYTLTHTHIYTHWQWQWHTHTQLARPRCGNHCLSGSFIPTSSIDSLIDSFIVSKWPNQRGLTVSNLSLIVNWVDFISIGLAGRQGRRETRERERESDATPEVSHFRSLF